VEETRTWRDVPLSAFDEQPRTRGGWHLPKPGQSSYIPPVDEAAVRAALDAEPLPAEPITDDLDLLPFDDSPAAPVIPPAAEAPPPLEAASEALIPIDEGDEDDSGVPSESFSMSELIALATLADAATTPPSSSSDASSFDPAAFDPADPVSYARRQMELLQQQQQSTNPYDPFDGGTAALTPTDSRPAAVPTGQVDALDPAEYARQQLAALQGEAAPAVPALTPEERALAQRYHDAETRIADLRRMYQNGQITREAFEQGLRASMVLDDNRVYWMLGTESDRWYKYENDQWLPANPPVLDKEAALSRPAEPEAGATVPTQTIGDAWIPARVPVSDPEATIPGTGAIFMAVSYTHLRAHET
jgi:hypothetical protein